MSVLADAPVGAPAGVTVVINGEADLLRVRSALRSEARDAGLSLTAATKLVTAGSELARNIVRYATHGQGSAQIERAEANGRLGVRAVFRDAGPGIADLDAAMRDGFSSAGSLGLGLPGSRRLVDQFTIETGPDQGTTVVIAQWNR
jgi:serine/threonine-protein kinase RsbT